MKYELVLLKILKLLGREVPPSLCRVIEDPLWTLPIWAKDFDVETWAQFFPKFLLGNVQCRGS
jgi:hypothetical protein